jgi:hypothetical protein
VTVTAVCVALVAVGVLIIVRWDARAPVPPARPARSRLARYAGYVGRAAAAGALAGVLAAGAGGRLVMRLLALTSPEAEGALTEAEARIGEITAGGTLGFIVFAGLPAGVLAGLLYALIAPALPRGRAGGVVLGALLLVLAGSRLEPLRADNIDFALVGPDWLTVLAFTALAVFQGMLVVAIAGRLGLAARPRLILGDRRLIAGRLAVVVLSLAALPGFAGALTEILSA